MSGANRSGAVCAGRVAGFLTSKVCSMLLAVFLLVMVFI